MDTNVIVIGGGAAGLMAAISAARAGNCPVTILERSPRTGRKLLATGNGRCNLTNTNTSPARYYHAGSFVAPALSRFAVADTLSFFRGIGLLTKEEADGKVYPYSDQAGSVLDTLRFAAEREGVTIRTDCPVSSVTPRKKGGFNIDIPEERITANYVIAAPGSIASPKLGGSNDVYTLFTSLGHTRTPLYPALTQIKTDNTFTRSMKGLKADVSLELKAGGKTVAENSGELLFTEYGISGPAVFEVSRAVSTDKADSAVIDLMPAYSHSEITSIIMEHARFSLAFDELLTGIINKRIAQTVLRSLGFKLSESADITENKARAIASAIKAFTLEIKGTTGFENAQVAVGGIRTSEFSPDTLESKLVPGLFAAGEVLDVDGECGGFNLQWAWSSGWVAGKLGKL